MIFLLLVIYQIKHFLADFPLQNECMLGKFKLKGWVLPLLAHVGVHGLFTLIIALFVRPELAIYLAVFDMSVHFAMDRIKASPNMLGQYKALSARDMNHIFSYLPTLGEAGVKEKFGRDLKNNRKFWWSLGLDQAVHHLTHYAIIWVLVS